MSELKPTDKGYIEALAKGWVKFLKHLDEQESKNCITDYSRGYSDSLEHNNVPELIEAVKDYINCEQGLKNYALVRLKKEVTKAESNKLNQNDTRA